jgi:hypothetical protein
MRSILFAFLLTIICLAGVGCERYQTIRYGNEAVIQDRLTGKLYTLDYEKDANGYATGHMILVEVH